MKGIKYILRFAHCTIYFSTSCTSNHWRMGGKNPINYHTSCIKGQPMRSLWVWLQLGISLTDWQSP